MNKRVLKWIVFKRCERRFILEKEQLGTATCFLDLDWSSFVYWPWTIRRVRRQYLLKRKMGDMKDLMVFVSASLGAALDEIYQRLIDYDIARGPGTGNVCCRAPQRVRARGSREPSHGGSFDVGLRRVRDRRERSKPTDEMASRRNFWPRGIIGYVTCPYLFDQCSRSSERNNYVKILQWLLLHERE